MSSGSFFGLGDVTEDNILKNTDSKGDAANSENSEGSDASGNSNTTGDSEPTENGEASENASETGGQESSQDNTEPGTNDSRGDNEDSDGADDSGNSDSAAGDEGSESANDAGTNDPSGSTGGTETPAASEGASSGTTGGAGTSGPANSSPVAGPPITPSTSPLGNDGGTFSSGGESTFADASAGGTGDLGGASSSSAGPSSETRATPAPGSLGSAESSDSSEFGDLGGTSQSSDASNIQSILAETEVVESNDVFGTPGDDELSDNDGGLSFFAEAGNDRISITNLDFTSIDGGTGTDTLVLDLELALWDFTSDEIGQIDDIEEIQVKKVLASGSSTELKINETNIFEISGQSKTIRISSPGGNARVILEDDNNQDLTFTQFIRGSDGTIYNVFSNGIVNLEVSRDLTGIGFFNFPEADNPVFGTSADDILSDANGGNLFYGGSSTFASGTGNDVIRLSDTQYYVIDGSDGFDTIELDGIDIDLTSQAIFESQVFPEIKNIESIKSIGTSGGEVRIDEATIELITGADNTLRIEAADSVVLVGDVDQNMAFSHFHQNSTPGSLIYTVFTNGLVTLEVELDISRSGFGDNFLPTSEVFGTSGDDTFDNASGLNYFFGHTSDFDGQPDGDDTFRFSNSNVYYVRGGTGFNTIEVDGFNFDLTPDIFPDVRGIGRVVLLNNQSALTLSEDIIELMTDSGNTLKVEGVGEVIIVDDLNQDLLFSGAVTDASNKIFGRYTNGTITIDVEKGVEGTGFADFFDLPAIKAIVDDGNGFESVEVEGSSLDLSEYAGTALNDIEQVVLPDDGNSSLVISEDLIMSLTGNENTLRILGKGQVAFDADLLKNLHLSSIQEVPVLPGSQETTVVKGFTNGKVTIEIELGTQDIVPVLPSSLIGALGTFGDDNLNDANGATHLFGGPSLLDVVQGGTTFGVYPFYGNFERNGDDTFTVTSADVELVNGGSGFDTLNLENTSLDLTLASSPNLLNIDRIALVGNEAHTLTLDYASVQEMLSRPHINFTNPGFIPNYPEAGPLYIDGEANDEVIFANLESEVFTHNGTVTFEGIDYDEYIPVFATATPGVDISVRINSNIGTVTSTSPTSFDGDRDNILVVEDFTNLSAVDGGAGKDVLFLDSDNLHWNFTILQEGLINNIELIAGPQVAWQGTGQTDGGIITLSEASIEAITDDDNTLVLGPGLFNKTISLFGDTNQDMIFSHFKEATAEHLILDPFHNSDQYYTVFTNGNVTLEIAVGIGGSGFQGSPFQGGLPLGPTPIFGSPGVTTFNDSSGGNYFYGTGESETYSISTFPFFLAWGGAGFDTLEFNGIDYDLSQPLVSDMQQFEKVSLVGSEAQTLNINAERLISNGEDNLYIDGESNDIVNIDELLSDFTNNGVVSYGGQDYQEYFHTASNKSLLIETDITNVNFLI